MADEYKRINLLIGTQTALAAGQEEGMPGIVSDNAWRLGWYANGAWKLAAMRGTSESFTDVALTGLAANAIPRLDASKKTVASGLSDDGDTIASSRSVVVTGDVSAKGNHVAGDASTPGSFYSSGSTTIWPALWFMVASVSRFVLRFSPPGTGADVLEFVSRNDDGTSREVLLKISRAVGGWVTALYQLVQWGGEKVISAQSSLTPDTPVANTTTETSIINGATSGFTAVSNTANRWNVLGATSRLEIMGRISSAASQTITVRFKRNGATVASVVVSGQSFGTNTMWRMFVKRVTTATGAGGNIRIIGRFYYTAGNANGTVSAQEIYADLTGQDMTAASTWDVTVQWGAASASNTITCQHAEQLG